MKNALILVAAAVLALMCAACAAEPLNGDNGEYTVELEGNATTGCKWEYTMDKEGIVRETENDYIQNDNPDMLDGVGGTYTFTFAPEGEGEVTLHFVYRQPWEPDAIYDECDITLKCDGACIGEAGEGE